ncbi:hypothetical protein NHQ30_001303 [Ciborinia camelliae]|nr:hypothetical protein NHQ30_001303 [Ciborinia camelliae]
MREHCLLEEEGDEVEVEEYRGGDGGGGGFDDFVVGGIIGGIGGWRLGGDDEIRDEGGLEYEVFGVDKSIAYSGLNLKSGDCALEISRNSVLVTHRGNISHGLRLSDAGGRGTNSLPLTLDNNDCFGLVDNLARCVLRFRAS